MQEKYMAAYTLLQSIINVLKENNRQMELCEVYMLLALTYNADGRKEDAYNSFEKNLSIAAERNFIRLLADEGEAMYLLSMEFRRQKALSVGLILLLVCLVFSCITGCSGDYKADSEYNFENYAVSYEGLNLHMDSTYKSEFGKKNIILVHGLTYSSHEFDINYKDYSLVRFLADKGYTVWRIDIAGYGQSDKPDDGFIVNSDYAADNIYYAVNDICNITGVNKIDVLGWSWGTVTTSRFVANHPEKVNKLILYAPIVSGVGESISETDYHENTWENAAGDFQVNDEGRIDESITEPTVVEYFCSNCWKYDGKGSPNGPRNDICVDESVELIDMSKINVPTLLIYGDADPYLNYGLIDKMYQELPDGSERKIINGAAHCAYIERPYYQDFQDTIIDFLR